MSKKKLDHDEAITWAKRNLLKLKHSMQVHYAMRYRSGLETFSGMSCFGGMSSLGVDNLEGVYVLIIPTDPKVADFDQSRTCLTDMDSSTAEKIAQAYLKFILNPFKSPWRKILGRCTRFKNDKGSVYMVYIPFTANTHPKFYINALAAIRAAWYNFGSIRVWYEGVQNGLDPIEALLVSMHVIMKNNKDKPSLVRRISSTHYYHNPYNYGMSIDTLRNGTPSLEKITRSRSFSMDGFSSIWCNTKIRPPFDFVHFMGAKESKYIGAFGYLHKTVNDKVDSFVGVNLKECFENLKKVKEKWAA